MQKITRIHIVPPDVVAGDDKRLVMAELEDGSRHKLFGFYPRELRLEEAEDALIGLSIKEAGEAITAVPNPCFSKPGFGHPIKKKRKSHERE